MFDRLEPAELSEILALAWVGQGSYDSADFSDAVTAAHGVPPDDIALLLANKPDLADAIEAALIMLGIRLQADAGTAQARR